MELIRDDPIIDCVQRAGYPPWIEDVEPVCPVCGAVCETVYKDKYGDIVGCDECLTSCDAAETDECFPEAG